MRSIVLLLATSLILIVTFCVARHTLHSPKATINGVEVSTVWYVPDDSSDSSGDGPKINIIEVPDPTVETHDEKWLNQYLYMVESFVDNGDGTYTTTLVNIEGAQEESFDDLRRTFYRTTYSEENNYDIASGVNCQGMVCYIASWCQQHEHEYAVEYYNDHVIISVFHNSKWYRFNFTQFPEITVVE